MPAIRRSWWRCAEKINNDLGWSAKYDLREMVTSAWAAWNQPERNP